MMAQQLHVEVISNNIANMTTTGYKRRRPEFQDLLYQNQRRIGATPRPRARSCRPACSSASASRRPPSTASTSRATSSAPRTASTSRSRAAAISWSSCPSGELAYTRSGNFQLSPEGQLVTADGYTVSPGITVPQDAVEVSINQEGLVSAKIAGQVEEQELGQLAARDLRQRGRPGGHRQQPAAWRPPPPARPGRHRPAPTGSAGAAGLPRELERQPGAGDHRADRRPAGLRHELQGHLRVGRDDGHRDPAALRRRCACSPPWLLLLGLAGAGRRRGCCRAGAAADPRLSPRRWCAPRSPADGRRSRSARSAARCPLPNEREAATEVVLEELRYEPEAGASGRCWPARSSGESASACRSSAAPSWSMRVPAAGRSRRRDHRRSRPRPGRRGARVCRPPASPAAQIVGSQARRPLGGRARVLPARPAAAVAGPARRGGELIYAAAACSRDRAGVPWTTAAGRDGPGAQRRQRRAAQGVVIGPDQVASGRRAAALRKRGRRHEILVPAGAGLVCLALLAGCSNASAAEPRRPAAGALADREPGRPGELPAGVAADARPRARDCRANSLWRPGAGFFRDQRARGRRHPDRPGQHVRQRQLVQPDHALARQRGRASRPSISSAREQARQDLPERGRSRATSSSWTARAATPAGATSRTEEIRINVAAVVTQILPNGNLVIQGRQEVRVNFEMREVIVAGIVRPRGHHAQEHDRAREDRRAARRLWRPRPDHRRAAAALRRPGARHPAAVLRPRSARFARARPPLRRRDPAQTSAGQVLEDRDPADARHVEDRPHQLRRRRQSPARPGASTSSAR